MMRATTLKAGKASVVAMVGYYAGLAADQLHRDGRTRGPIDYYLDPNEPPGRWWGRGCAEVGLAGDVHPEQMEALLQARHPGNGRRLGRGFGAKSARAFDATFSAPKSVSVLWALSPASVRAVLLATHDTAVMAALAWFEQYGCVTRRGTNGIHQVDARGLVVGLFRQHTSREADPQLHTHALIWAKVQDLAGKWLSLDARFLKYQQRSIGWVYAAALRSELSARLGVSWGPVTEGHADIEGVPRDLLKLFSQRSVQVEARLAKDVAAWVDDHDGAEPDHRTLWRLERDAVTDSRPDKFKPIAADQLHEEWSTRARRAGFDTITLPNKQRRLPGTSDRDDEAVIGQALAAVTESSSTWLQADLAREIAARLPAEVADSAVELVQVVDELAGRAAGRCVELHPAGDPGVPRRLDGRPVSEHVVDRRLSAPVVLDQEARLLAWAQANVGLRLVVATHEEAQSVAARDVAGARRLVLVVGPAGTGKTTMLSSAAADLRKQGRAVVGLAPSGKAADVLSRETASPATTLAKLLYEHSRRDGPRAEWRLPPHTTLILDEAGMASTEDLARLVALADRHRWRLVCVGDPAQLPAVGRGGMFAQWCATLPAHRLEEVRRFTDAWQAEASLLLREGDPAAAGLYAEHGRLATVHPALLPDRVARQHEKLAARGDTVAITTASTGTARSINVEIQRRRNLRQLGPSLALADGTRVFVGDQVATRRNDATLVATGGTTVRNRQTWIVTDIDDGSLAVTDRHRGDVRLPARYIARHVELGWAVTGYGNQGVTVDHGICVVEPASTRAGILRGHDPRSRSQRGVGYRPDRSRGCRGGLRLDDGSSTECPDRSRRARATPPSRRRLRAGARCPDIVGGPCPTYGRAAEATGSMDGASPARPPTAWADDGPSRDFAVLSGLVQMRTRRRRTPCQRPPRPSGSR